MELLVPIGFGKERDAKLELELTWASPVTAPKR